MPGPEMLIVVAIIAVLFGGSKIPQLARSLGSAKHEFEKGATGPSPERRPVVEPLVVEPVARPVVPPVVNDAAPRP